MSKIALLDGDSWVYRCGFAAEKTYYLVGNDSGSNEENRGWVFTQYDNHKEAKAACVPDSDGVMQTEMWSRKEVEPLENCLQMVKTSLENTLSVLGTDSYRLYLSGRRNFRDDIYPDYKANRDGVAKPKYYRDIRDYLVGQWRASVVDGYEADDALGMEAGITPESIVVAVDKDLDQIPGDHYNWTTSTRYVVTKQDGLKFFYQQMLSGDPTDNIQGIPGIGPIKAEKMIANCPTPHHCATRVRGAYAEAFGERADEVLDRNARLLWIWRKANDSPPFWRHIEGVPSPSRG